MAFNREFYYLTEAFRRRSCPASAYAWSGHFQASCIAGLSEIYIPIDVLRFQKPSAGNYVLREAL